MGNAHFIQIMKPITLILLTFFCFSCTSDKTIELDEKQIENALHSDDFFEKSNIKASLAESDNEDLEPVYIESEKPKELPDKIEEKIDNTPEETSLKITDKKKEEIQKPEVKTTKSTIPIVKRPKKEMKSAQIFVKNNAVASDKEIVNNHLEKIIRMVYTDRYVSPNFEIRSSSLNNNDIIYVDLTWADNWNNKYKMGGKLSVRSNNTLFFEINERNINVEALEFTEDDYRTKSIIGSI